MELAPLDVPKGLSNGVGVGLGDGVIVGVGVIVDFGVDVASGLVVSEVELVESISANTFSSRFPEFIISKVKISPTKTTKRNFKIKFFTELF